jgi:hypothetical protein
MGANQLVHMAPIWCTKLSHGPHTSHAAPKWCHLSPMGYAGPIQFMQRPYSTCSSHLAPSASHLEHIAPIWLPYGTCCSHMVHAAPVWHHPPPMWLHLAPICCPLLPYSASSHVAPIQWMQLSYSGICLPYGTQSSHMTLCGACGSCRAHVVPSSAWSSYMAAYTFHMAPSGSHTAHVAPIQCTPLPYGPHFGVMQLPYGATCLPNGTIWLPHGFHMAHMAPAWCTWLPRGPHTVYVAPIWHHLPPIWCTQHPYSTHSSHKILICHRRLPHGAI